MDVDNAFNLSQNARVINQSSQPSSPPAPVKGAQMKKAVTQKSSPIDNSPFETFSLSQSSTGSSSSMSHWERKKIVKIIKELAAKIVAVEGDNPLESSLFLDHLLTLNWTTVVCTWLNGEWGSRAAIKAPWFPVDGINITPIQFKISIICYNFCVVAVVILMFCRHEP